MDTTQSFGISAGAKTKSISGSMMFPSTINAVGSVVDNGYYIFHIAGTGDSVTSLTGVQVNDAMTSGFIAKGGEVMESYALSYASTLGGTSSIELYCIICPKSTYENSASINYTETLIKTGLSFAGGSAFAFSSDAMPSITLNEGDLVAFAVKNVSGSTFTGLSALLTIYFNSTL